MEHLLQPTLQAQRIARIMKHFIAQATGNTGENGGARELQAIAMMALLQTQHQEQTQTEMQKTGNAAIANATMQQAFMTQQKQAQRQVARMDWTMIAMAQQIVLTVIVIPTQPALHHTALLPQPIWFLIQAQAITGITIQADGMLKTAQPKHQLIQMAHAQPGQQQAL